MSELGKANETSMGLPRSGGSSCTTVTSPNITTTTTASTNSPHTSANNINNHNNNNDEGSTKSGSCSSACRRSNSTEPRGQKRPWDGLAADEGTVEGEPPSKLVCTSPPHALCAEDVPQQPHQPHDKQYRSSNKSTGSSSSTCNNSSSSNIMATEDLLPAEATCGVSDESDTDAEMEDERDFLDEEDKDSGFIDSHSIDNSSDDDMDVRLTSVAAISSTNNTNNAMNSSSSSDLSEVQINCTLQSSSIEPVVSEISRADDNSRFCTLQSATESSIVPSSTVSNITTILPSCSSAFCAYSSLSSNFVPSSSSIGSSDLATGPGSYSQSSLGSCDSMPNSQVCTSAVDHFASISDPPTTHSSLQNSSPNLSSVYISEVFSTSIALSIDVRSSSTLPSLNGPTCSIGDSSPDNLVQSMSAVSTSPAQTLPSIISRDFPSSSDSSNMTVASANAETIVTSAYSGTVSSPVYDPHLYQPYSAEVAPRASASLPNGSWSCNFYDGNQPTMTNKYMEIQTSKISGGCPSPPPSSSQAIQCDANGKSYMDLGSSSPYTQTYSADCGNYTTSPSNNFSGVLYNNQTCTNSNNYNQQQQASQQSPNNQFYRPGYSQFSGFPSNEGCPSSYDGDSSVGCSYGYPPSYAPTRPIKMMPPRCGSPFCDPSKPSSLRSPCYQQQRLAVLNMSMCKLNRFSRCADPRLHKSVLICNTLRLIEKEFESEGTSMNTILSQQHMMQAGLPPHCPPPPPTPPPLAMAGGSSEGPLPSMHPPIISSPVPGPCTPPPVLPPPIMPPYNGSSNPYRGPHYPDGSYEDLRAYSPVLECEPLVSAPDNPNTLHNLRTSNAPPSPVLEPSSVTVLGNIGGVLPCNSSNSINTGSISNNFTGSNDASCVNTSSSSSSEDRTESGINWCSVLSLPSQSDLDSLNSTDFCEWGSESNMDIEYSNSSSCTTSPARSCNSSSNNSSSSSSSSSSSCSNSGSTSTSLTDVHQASPYKLDLPSLSADDVLKSFPDQPRRIEPSEELDNLIDVLVES
ncbi:SERTA domain [Trinorchestia longiramus]|nr:SERTA domain [Trinorchestia longiramus]